MPTLGKYNQLRAGLILLGFTALLSFAALATGCGMAGDSAGVNGYAPDGEASPLMDAQASLARHNVDEAQAIYNQIIADNPQPPGQAFAGKAITDLLLLPGSSALTTILVEHLHATSGIDANDTIYADEGYLYWLARGVPWSDKGTYSGIRTLIADELPWSQQRLSATRAFFEGLNAPLNFAMDDLVLLADTMAGIENDLARAIADPNFDTIYIPGLTFHAERLDLFLGRAELHILSGLLSASRAAIYFVAAYEYDFTLDELLGSQTEQRSAPKEGWTTEDYALAFLDGRFLRQVRDPARLEEARVALDASLESAILAINAGMNAPGQTTIH